jgi:hypothetical protein
LMAFLPHSLAATPPSSLSRLCYAANWTELP